MRIAALALVVFAGTACRRGALQQDAGGPGIIGSDAGLPGGDAGGISDAPGVADVRFPTTDANCGQVSLSGAYVSPRILAVLDRSIAAAPADWNSFVSGVAATITANDARVDWGLYVFPNEGPACGAGTVGATINLPPASGSAFHVVAHLAAAGTGANGSPTAAAIQTAAAYMLSLTDPIPKYIMLVTGGAPTCAGTIDALSADPVQAQADAVAAIAAAAAAGLPTLVVAPSTTTAAGDVDALNALAVAGGYAQAPPGPKFFTETTLGQSFTPLNTAAACAFPLRVEPPPVPGAVVVTFNDMTVPRDRSHVAGWDYIDASMQSMMFYGSWCEQVKASPSWTITAFYGCPLL